MTNTSCRRTFSSISTCTSPSENVETCALPWRTPSSRHTACASGLFALPEKINRFRSSFIALLLLFALPARVGNGDWQLVIRHWKKPQRQHSPLLRITNHESPITALLAGAAGFEPAHAGIKTRCLNRLATPLLVARDS